MGKIMVIDGLDGCGKSTQLSMLDAALRELNTASMTLRESKVSAPVLIRIGIVSGTLEGLVARQMTEYVKQNDRMRFQITESSAQELMDMVRQEKLDMAIVDTTNRDRSLHFRKLCQRDFCVALPAGHPLAGEAKLLPQQLTGLSQVVIHTDTESSFANWANHDPGEETVLCTVNTAQSALELVAAGAGLCILPTTCIRKRRDVTFVPLQNWHQALYMCILYDKWLEPPVWDFVELVVKSIRDSVKEHI